MPLSEPLLAPTQLSLTDTPPAESSPAFERETMPLSVVILYETAAAARRAVGMISRLVSLSDSEFALKPVLWRFDLLEYASLAQAAASDVLRADLLVLATEKTRALPSAAKRWLEECFAHGKGPRPATVALFGADDDWSILAEDDQRLRVAHA